METTIYGQTTMTIDESMWKTYSAKDKSFVTELSDHDLKVFFNEHSGIELLNPKTGNTKLFTYFKTDYIYGEDIAGWWFQSTDGIRLLVIND